MVTPTYYPIIGGAETAVRRLTIDLNEIGIHTDVMTFNMEKIWRAKWSGKTEVSNDGYCIFRIPGLNWVPFAHSNRNTMGFNLFPGRFTHLLKTYDVLHFHSEFSFPLFSYSLRKAKVFHFHGLDYDFFQRYFLGRFMLKNIADLYISLTEQMKQDLVTLGIPEGRIRCLPNGVDTDIFRPQLSNKEDNLLLFVGRISSGKGLHVLLAALRYLEKSIRLVIIGPPDWDSAYFNRVQSMIKRENERGKHRIEYAGEKNHEDLVSWYQKAAIFVLPPPKYEALGIVNLEALACETPVVATKVGGIPEVVHDEENGILVEPNNPIKLANAIQYLLDNDALRREFGKNGRDLVVKKFSNKKNAEKLARIYSELL